MFIVTVTYEIEPENRESFHAAILTNASASQRNEPGCRQFDVSFNDDGVRCFLYEVYDDSAAFDAHRATPHFNEYDRTTKDWIISKKVETWRRANNNP